MTAWHLPLNIFGKNISKIKTTYGYILFRMIKSLRNMWALIMRIIFLYFCKAWNYYKSIQWDNRNTLQSNPGTQSQLELFISSWATSSIISSSMYFERFFLSSSKIKWTTGSAISITKRIIFCGHSAFYICTIKWRGLSISAFWYGRCNGN